MSNSVPPKLPIRLRTMCPEDLEAAMELKNAEGWNQTIFDWELFMENSPESCLVATYRDKVIGTVTGINYENKVAWIGMMLVNQAYRGQGVSKMLMTAVIQSLEAASSIKLDATPAGYPVYDKLGFKQEYALIRMTTDKFTPSLIFEENSANVIPLTSENLFEIFPMDKGAFGSDRKLVLIHAQRQQPDLACMYKEDGNVKGFLLARSGTRYLHIGPLVATDAQVAKTLLSFACIRTRDVPLVLDSSVSNSHWVSWLESCGFKKQRDLYRMYLKSNSHPGKPEQCFLVAGPELG
ncbi:GNAT family N-acetyltransferase [Lunatibacter salilacus]|uniref:GNAT family N-acetyltransferase n=1 Tax=Lunatibacter salilacus TaxID=2483804 RepID=UPI00131E689F|nr:GNAT family N-acetyltransferase [Lunatibacter salilacus]